MIDLPGEIVVTKAIVNMTHFELYERKYTAVFTVKVGDKQNNTYMQCSNFILPPGTSIASTLCTNAPFGRNVLIEITPNEIQMISQMTCDSVISDFGPIGMRQVGIYGFERKEFNIWEVWNQWGPCMEPCGYGSRKRNRSCTKATGVTCFISQNQWGPVHFQYESCIIKDCSSAVYYWTIGGIVGLFVVVMLGIVLWYRKYKMIVYFEGLRPNPNFELDPNQTLLEQIEKLPYDLHWEFPRYDVKFGSVLGEGNFGRVWHAKSKGIKVIIRVLIFGI